MKKLIWLIPFLALILLPVDSWGQGKFASGTPPIVREKLDVDTLIADTAHIADLDVDEITISDAKYFPGISGDPRAWATADYSRDSAKYYQTNISLYDTPGANDTVLFMSGTGAGFINGLQVLNGRSTSDLNLMSDSAYIMIYVDGEETPRIDIPIAMLWMSHWNHIDDDDVLHTTAAGIRDSTLSNSNFSTLCSYNRSSGVRAMMGSRKITIPYSNGFSIYVRSTFTVDGNMVYYIACHYVSTPASDITNLGMFRYINCVDTVYNVDTDTVGIAGNDPADYQLFDIEGTGMVHLINLAWRGETAYLNVLEDSIYFQLDDRPLTDFKSSSTDDFFGTWYYGEWDTPAIGNDIAGRSLFYRNSSNHPNYVYYRYLFPYHPTSFQDSAKVGVRIEQDGNFNRWTLTLDGDLVASNVISCKIDGDSIGVTYATSHLNTMNLFDTAVTAHENVSSATVSTDPYRVLTINSIDYTEIEVTDPAVTGGGGQAGITEAEVSTSRPHEFKWWLWYYSAE